MVILKASRRSEAGVMPRQEGMARMIRYNEEMLQAGIPKSADGLKPSRFGKHVTFRPSGETSVAEGPSLLRAGRFRRGVHAGAAGEGGGDASGGRAQAAGAARHPTERPRDQAGTYFSPCTCLIE